jgi:uncharacterized protein YjcR
MKKEKMVGQWTGHRRDTDPAEAVVNKEEGGTDKCNEDEVSDEGGSSPHGNRMSEIAGGS